MTSLSDESSTRALLVAAIALLGLVLSPLAESLIARLLPRIGPPPAARVRITTAVATSTVCTAFAIRFSGDLTLPAFVLLAILGVQLARIDISLHLLPNPLVISLLLGGLILLLAEPLVQQKWTDLLRAVAGAAVLFAVYAILAIISPKAIGMGDVKLAGPIGLYLGYLGWNQLLYGGLVGFVLGGLAAALILRSHGHEKPSEVAYGPSMLAATIAVSLISG